MAIREMLVGFHNCTGDLDLPVVKSPKKAMCFFSSPILSCRREFKKNNKLQFFEAMSSELMAVRM